MAAIARTAWVKKNTAMNAKKSVLPMKVAPTTAATPKLRVEKFMAVENRSSKEGPERIPTP